MNSAMEDPVLFELPRLGDLREGIFLFRPNRFVAIAELEGMRVRVHVADTGRLEEILTPGRPLLLLHNRPGMKTDCTLIAAGMEEGWVLINSRIHPAIARKAIENGILGFYPELIRQEISYGTSRFDYLVDDAYVELKGCSLVEQRLCLFPNAPTVRGVRHLRELAAVVEEGYRAYILIMALRPCQCFCPHPERDPEFRKTFREVLENGVNYRGFHVGIDEELRIVYRGSLMLCGNGEGVPSPG